MGGREIGSFLGTNWHSLSNAKPKGGTMPQAGLGADVFSSAAGGSDVVEFNPLGLPQPMQTAKPKEMSLGRIAAANASKINVNCPEQDRQLCSRVWEGMKEALSEEQMQRELATL